MGHTQKRVGASDTPTLFYVSLWTIHKRGLVRLAHQPSCVPAFGPYTKEGWCVWHANPLLCQPLGQTEKMVGAPDTPTLFCVSPCADHERGLVRLTHQFSFASSFWVKHKRGLVRHKRAGASGTSTLFCGNLWTRHKRGLVRLTNPPSFVSAFGPDTNEGWCV